MNAQLPSVREVARLLGGVPSGRNVACPGPGHSAADRSLHVRLDACAPDGFIVHSFAGDEPLLCRDFVREKLGLQPWHQGSASEPRRVICHKPALHADYQRDVLQRRLVAQSLWSRSSDGHASLAEVYLQSRGINLERWPGTLRFLPASPPDHLWPTLVAAYGMPTEPEPGVLSISPSDVTGVQLTYLKQDGGGKAPIKPAKRSIGRGHPMPIVLAPTTDSLGLVIAEGIEDALSLHVETGLATWAAGGAGRMPTLATMVPDYADSVTIVADDNEAGRNGAHGLRDSLDTRGIHADAIFLRHPKE